LNVRKTEQMNRQQIKNMKTREYTNLLLERIEEGLYDKDQVIMACVKYMSEEAVQDMMHCNEMLFDEDTED
jgi:hypothetical protein